MPTTPSSALSALSTSCDYKLSVHNYLQHDEFNRRYRTSLLPPSSQAAAPYLISANTGTLVRTAFSFSGWNTAADGNGTTYLATGAVTVSPTANLVLHPKWTALKFTVTYFRKQQHRRNCANG
jgi:hypothetical protein